MKLQFKNQDYQTDAVKAVTELFSGQEKRQSTFSIVAEQQQSLLQNDFGIGNALLIDKETLLKNMQSIQKKNNLPLSSAPDDMRFCIEMETGTGKTYVYTKTIFELHKRYGFTKFIVVVPSVAIREGVYKSFQITEEHFARHYDNVPCRYFIYNSAKLSDVRQFAQSSNIEIMIINIDAFKKAENIINQPQDKLGGESAMRYIQDTRPVVIIDEPQSVDNTPKSKEAIESLNPLCVLRYSATHREKINLLYRLTPVDAYQMGLVKQISVASNRVEGGHNRPYIKLLSVSHEKGYKARIELDVLGKDGKVARKKVTVKPGTDLYVTSGSRELYEGYTIEGIDCLKDNELIEFGNTEILRLGQAIGDIDENKIKREQILRTIEAHLDKEQRYLAMGIKVLSLFFIDKVENYRAKDGEAGIYAKMFEECYAELIQRPKFEKVKERFGTGIQGIHDGYFSQDKKGNYKNTKGDTLDDYNTYNTIMKDKEWLLSFDCPLRFIFSHSTLKEGWDNPNVFQVCTLIDQKSTFTCRQKIGRGLRLCVNQDGERIEDKNINILHVMANESFAEFANTLQKEIEEETGVKFGIIQIDLFSGMVYMEKTTEEKTITQPEAEVIVNHLQKAGVVSHDGKVEKEAVAAIQTGKIELPKELEPVKDKIVPVIEQAEKVDVSQLSGLTYTQTIEREKTVSYEDAQALISHFEQKGYISSTGKIKDTMKSALQSGTLDLPKKFENARQRFETIIAQADNRPPIRDASKDVVVKLKKQVVQSPAFLALWDKIKQKTAYRVQIDSDRLITQSVKELKEMPPMPKMRIITETADIDIAREKVRYTERGVRAKEMQEEYTFLPDILTIVGEECLIKRKTVYEIFERSGRVQDFVNNPQLFLEAFLEIVKHNRHQLAIDGISYIKLAGEEYYAQEIFNCEELMANLDKNAVAVQNSVYDYIVYDSTTIERPFAVALDNDPDVKMFFKIPSSFTIDTPIGSYNPDWAVYIERNGEQKMYFVLETKGSTSLIDLRTVEQLKIHCGKRHFEALENGVELRVAKDWKEERLKL